MTEHPTSSQGGQATGYGYTASPALQEEPGHRQAPVSGKLAFVLSGGGSLGSVQVGCIEALMQQRIFPDLVVGTSVGALNGVWLAKNPTLEGVEELKGLWLSMKPHGPFQEGNLRVLMRLLRGRSYLFANKTLRKLVCQYVADNTFEDMAIPAVVVATNLETGEPEYFHQGLLEPAVMASTAIPGVFPSVEIEGVEYIDGAMMSNCGLEPAWDQGARRIVVIEIPHPPPARGIGILKPLARALHVSLVRLCHLEVGWFSQRCSVVALEPAMNLEGHDFNDFSKSAILMETGRAWTEEFLQSAGGELLRSFSRREA